MTDEDILTPEQSLAIIQRQQAEVARSTDVDNGLIYGLWGTAWLLGFGLHWLATTHRLDVDSAVTNTVFFVLLGAAASVTAIRTTRAFSGIGGPNSVAGTYYGLSWLLGLGCFGLLMGAFGRTDASEELLSLVSSAVAVLLVGTLYCAGAAVWRHPAQLGLGAWILVVDVVGAWVGLPHFFLVLSVAGGGGFLLAAIVARVRQRR